jgi:hypothetical protein
MATPKTTKPKSQKQQTEKATDVQTDVITPAADHLKGAKLPPKDTSKGYEIVTSLRLKRSFVQADARKVGMFLSESDFYWLNTTGIRYGVTFDEIVKALITKEQMSNGTSDLSNYIPALNL